MWALKIFRKICTALHSKTFLSLGNEFLLQILKKNKIVFWSLVQPKESRTQGIYIIYYRSLEAYSPVSTGIGPQSLPEWAFRARPGLGRICLCPKVARIAEHKFANR